MGSKESRHLRKRRIQGKTQQSAVLYRRVNLRCTHNIDTPEMPPYAAGGKNSVDAGACGTRFLSLHPQEGRCKQTEHFICLCSCRFSLGDVLRKVIVGEDDGRQAFNELAVRGTEDLFTILSVVLAGP